MYVLRVFQGAVCFWKNTYDDWEDAVITFANYRDNIYTHIVLEIINDRFSQMWFRLAPFPRYLEGGDINE